MLHSLSKILLIGGALLLGVSFWQKNALPPSASANPALLDEPLQEVVQHAPFEAQAGEVVYQVKPLYQYTLHGLVVSRHDTHTWWDYLHREWNDLLNVADLCVVWGNNIRREAYRNIEFSSGQFTCNFQTSSTEAFNAFDQTAISNNHLLSNNPLVVRTIQDVRIGDQVRVTGYLAEYSHNHGLAFRRGTSTVRTDSGNGACETVWVEDFQIVRRGGGPWHMLFKLSWVMLAAGLVAWLVMPPRPNTSL
jgi:hypothetical protein